MSFRAECFGGGQDAKTYIQTTDSCVITFGFGKHVFGFTRVGTYFVPGRACEIRMIYLFDNNVL